jgi:hypothetical protein
MGTPRSFAQLEQLTREQDRFFEVHNQRPPPICMQPQPTHALTLQVLSLLLRLLSHQAEQ